MIGTGSVATREEKRRPFAEMDFNLTPFIVFWEVTRACALACRHCRAKAQPRRHPQELTTTEGLQLIGQVAALGSPLLVITGGDPMMRPELFDFIRYGTKQNLKVSLAPSATRLVTLNSLTEAQEAGVVRVSFSLDGATAEIHDAFRQTPGSFQRTMTILKYTQDIKLSRQINTTVSRHNIYNLEAIVEKIAASDPIVWDVFFLVPTGRGNKEDVISAEEHEQVFHWLYDLSAKVPFEIKTTAAEHYRRVAIQRKQAEERVGNIASPAKLAVAAPGFVYQQDGLSRYARGINDGKGCCFISHIGEVYPSGFLPVVAGNIREQSLAEIYRQSPLFQSLRDVSKLRGKCGCCEYKQICGGSRARAYAITGDYLAAEPCCIYQPAAQKECQGTMAGDNSCLRAK